MVRTAVPLASVLEVGSTAVEGVVGKQDIDIVVRVPAESFADTRDILDRMFSRNASQMSNSEYQGYLVTSSLDVAIQLVVAGGKYDTFVAFLQALSTDPTIRQAYNQLKIAWNGQPMQDYRVAKQEFIESVLNRGEVGSNE